MESKTDTVKQCWLYVLKLEQDKYYIGKTFREFPEHRIKEHIAGFYTAQWVKKYPFKELIELVNLERVTNLESIQAEQKLTLKYMEKYGINNVRGGTLNYSGIYIKIGNRFHREQDFHIASAILFLTAVILYLGFKLYFK